MSVLRGWTGALLFPLASWMVLSGCSSDDDASGPALPVAEDASAETTVSDAGDGETDSTTNPDGGVDGPGDAGEDSKPDGADTGADTGATGCCGAEDITCPGSITPAPSGVCGVTSPGTSGARLIRGTVLAPAAVYRNGSVLVGANGRILCVGCDCATEPDAQGAAVVDCANGVISPGLINTHDHITYANNAPVPHGAIRYEHRHDWRLGTHGHTELPFESAAPAAMILAAELRFVAAGATSTVSAGGEPGLLRNLDRANLREGIPGTPPRVDTFPFDDASGTLISNGCNYPGDPTQTSDIESVSAYLPHLAEGIDVEARNELVCAATPPTNLLGERTSVVQGIAMLASDAQRLQGAGSRVVWSPRSNIGLYGNTAPVTLLDTSGVLLALGTDWMPTGSMNLLRELRCADELNSKYFGGHFSDLDLWRMVTTNAAIAAGVESGLGMLKPGYLADISVFDGTLRKDHRAVIEATEKDVVLVMRAGLALYGDASLLSEPAIGSGACEPLTVCGAQKKACVSQDTGDAHTLADLVMAASSHYQLFSDCQTPQDEPSCVPSRDSYPAGITATDSDGDGVPDSSDDCPSVFNPIRLLETAQADEDHDGKGDACDECPLDPTNKCPAVHADDIDGDQVENGADNCLTQANPLQEDSDGDGHGNACDQCPTSPNPGPDPCTFSIPALRNPADSAHPPSDSAVRVAGGWVTAVKTGGGGAGFYLQDDSLLPYTGIFVFTGTLPVTVQRGNRVTVTGTYTEYYELSEIDAQEVAVTDNSTSLPFGPLQIADPATISTGGTLAEQYESMLLELDGVQVTVQNPDAPADYDEFVVTGNLRIDDLLYPALDNTYPVGASLQRIVGIHSYAFSERKLLPRDAADLVP